MKKFIGIALTATLLAGCQNTDISKSLTHANVMGLGGALVGGLAGSQFGGGEGRLWAAGAGVLIGGLRWS